MTWFARRNNKSASRRPKSTRSHMQFEPLERREVYVVGAFGIPAPVAAGTGFDGVVQLGFPNGGCTGSLLWTGRHILTAAHCVDKNIDTDGDGRGDVGDGVVDAGVATVRFDLPSGPIQLTNIPMANVTMHGSWNGRLGGGNDIAILTLPELAPSGTPGAGGAERYGIYRDADEVNQIFTVVGYGSTNPDNTTFDNRGAGGTKRSGQNRFDSASGTVLNFDFDTNGARTSVTGESNTAPGDSGGPSFINGLVAGVTSGGTLRNSGLGDDSFNTRVSTFANWIDTTVGGAYNLVLDMQNQVAGNDGLADLIVVRRNGANLEIVVNNVIYHSDLASNISAVTIRGSSDNDTVVLGTQVALTVDGRGGNNTLGAPNQLNGWRIAGVNQGEIGSWARFSSVQNLKGGSDVDIFAFDNGARVNGTIRGGGNTDVLDYSRYTTSVDVNLQDGRATGTTGVSEIENVKGGSGDDLLIGNDSVNSLQGNGGNDILDGRAGDDTLSGNAGHDLLIGGLGADVLDGGADNDILIGGRLNTTNQNIRREWARQDIGYYAKVDHLRNGTGWNGTSRLTSSTVQVDDAAADQLTGGTGDDWLWGLSSELRDRGIVSVYYKTAPSQYEFLN